MNPPPLNLAFSNGLDVDSATKNLSSQASRKAKCTPLHQLILTDEIQASNLTAPNLVDPSLTIKNALGCFLSKGGKRLKPKYLRIKIIRGHKRANRQISKGKIPSKMMHEFNISDKESRDKWAKLRVVFFDNEDVLKKQSETRAGKRNDSKNKKNYQDGQKSFNLNFFKGYFGNFATRESFYYYIEFLFAHMDPNLLCKRFSMYCCRSSSHEDECFQKWGNFKSYMTNNFVKELGCEPWNQISKGNLENEVKLELEDDSLILKHKEDDIQIIENR